MFNFNIMLIVYLYLFIIFFLIIYDIYTKIINKKDSLVDRIYYLLFKDDIEKELKNIKKDNKVTDKHKKKYLKVLSNPKKLLVYEESLKSITNKDKYYRQMSNVYLELLKKYLKKEEVFKAYYIDFIHDRLNYLNTKSQIIETIKNYVNSDSIYIRWNTIKCLYRYNNPNLIYQSLKEMSINNKHYDSHLLSDDLLKVKNQKDLSKLLIDNFNDFSLEYQIGILNYLRRLKIDYKKEIFNIYITTENKEVRITSSRYFINNKYLPIKEYLVNILSNIHVEDIDEAIVAAEVLKSYESKEVKEVLINSLTSHEYYIRRNSAKSLSNFKITKGDISKIKKLNDKYALEIANHYIFEK